MREILPGIHHWTTLHPAIGVEVSSYHLVQQEVLIDPLVPEEGFAHFESGPPPRWIYLTSGLHLRDTGRFVERFGCQVRCPQAGLQRFAGKDPGFPIVAYAWGESLSGGIEAFEIGALCADETALVIPSAKAVALADGVMRQGEGPLMFPPDELMGADPEAVKKALRTAFSNLLTERGFDHLLLAHGEPWIKDGAKALQSLIK